MKTSAKVKKGIYRHYKGKKYRLIDMVRHSETLEEMVFYETLYENELCQLWVRPKDLFFSKIEIDGKLMDRFEFIGADTDPS